MRKAEELQKKILDYITERISDGIPPSVREIAAELNIKSTSTVHKYLKELESKGLIVRDANLNRAIKLPREKVVNIPLVGNVAAGQPILAIEEIEDYIPFRADHAEGLFALRVKGESMINAGIMDGDIIVARKIPVARNGEMVVALVGDEATVKTFYKENGVFRLQPENDTMEPIIVDSVQILGKVISAMRFYE